MPRPLPRKRRPLLRFARALALALAAAVALVAAADLHLMRSVAGRIVTPGDAPPCPVAIVLGASVRRDGSLSPMLADRVAAAARLWRDGKAAAVLISADRDFDRGYDEVGPMRDALVAHGVDPAAIVEDGRGRRTLDSMARAAAVFGYRAALVVTNDFHVPRAVYLGQHFGLDVHGVAADAGVERPLASTLRNLGREVLARALAVVDCHLLGTAPESLER